MLFFSFEKGPNGQMLLRFLPFYKNIPHSAKFHIPSHWGKIPPPLNTIWKILKHA